MVLYLMKREKYIQQSIFYIHNIKIVMFESESFKLRKRGSTSSNGSDIILSSQKIEALVEASARRKDLFDTLLEQSQPSFERNHELNNLNSLTPKNYLHHFSASPPQQLQAHNSVGCKCSKIDCLKLYCECFARGRPCTSACICVCCRNKIGNEQQINNAKSLVNYRQPGYFNGVPSWVPTRKCTCKKSLCKKKYCECFNAGLKCTQECECCNCENGKPEVKFSFLEERMEIQVEA